MVKVKNLERKEDYPGNLSSRVKVRRYNLFFFFSYNLKKKKRKRKESSEESDCKAEPTKCKMQML